MKKMFSAAAVLLCIVLGSAEILPPFSGIVSVKLKGGINAAVNGTSPLCYPGPIQVTVGVLDYQTGLDMTVDPFAENAIWQTVVGSLAPGALTFDFSVDTVMDGADVTVAIPGDPYEFDLTPLFSQVVADGNSAGKAYAFCFMNTGGPGKINLLSSEGTDSYADLVGIEVVDGSGTHLFKYRKTGGEPVTVPEDRIQYTGHRAAHNGNYNDQFSVGGHEGGPAGSGYEGIVQDRCAFFFHSGLAGRLGWDCPDYPGGAVQRNEGTARALSLSNMPNPFTGNTAIAYTLDRTAFVRLSIYNAAGVLVKKLENGMRNAGTYSMRWNDRQWPAGIYLLRLQTGDRVLNRTMIRMQ